MKYAPSSLALTTIILCWPRPAIAGVRLPIGAPVTVGQTLKVNTSGQVIPTTALTDQMIGVARTGATVTDTKIDIYTQGEKALCDCLAGGVRGDWLGLSATPGSGDAGGTVRPTATTLIGIVTADRDGSGECEVIIAPSSFASALAAAGDVVGPASATDNTLPRFDSATGKLIQGSGVVVDDSNVMSGFTADVGILTGSFADLGTSLTGTLAEADGGTGQATMEAAMEATPIDQLTLKEQSGAPGAAAANTLDLSVTDDPNPRLQGTDDNNDTHGWLRTFDRASADITMLFDTGMPDSDFIVTIAAVTAATGVITWTDASDTPDEQAFADALGTANVGEVWLLNQTRSEDVLVDTGTWSGAGRTLTVDADFRTGGDGTIDDWAATDVIRTNLNLGVTSSTNFSISLVEDIVSEEAEGATTAFIRLLINDSSSKGRLSLWDIDNSFQLALWSSLVAGETLGDYVTVPLSDVSDAHPYSFTCEFLAAGSQTSDLGMFFKTYGVE